MLVCPPALSGVWTAVELASRFSSLMDSPTRDSNVRWLLLSTRDWISVALPSEMPYSSAFC